MKADLGNSIKDLRERIAEELAVSSAETCWTTVVAVSLADCKSAIGLRSQRRLDLVPPQETSALRNEVPSPPRFWCPRYSFRFAIRGQQTKCLRYAAEVHWKVRRS